MGKNIHILIFMILMMKNSIENKNKYLYFYKKILYNDI